MREFTLKVEVDIIVKVDDDTTLDEAEQIALFNTSIISSIPLDTDKKYLDLDIDDYHVLDINET